MGPLDSSSSPYVEAIRQRLATGWIPPVAKLVGFRLTEIERDRAVIELEAGPQHANPMGTLHGGVLCDIGDAAMGMTYVSGLSLDEGFTTIELKANYLRPFWNGKLRAEGRMIRRGRKVGLVECRVTDEKGELVAYLTSTCMTLEGTAGAGLTRQQMPEKSS